MFRGWHVAEHVEGRGRSAGDERERKQTMIHRSSACTSQIRKRCLLTALAVVLILHCASYGEVPRLALERASNIALVPEVTAYLAPGEHLLHRFFDASPISPSGRYLAAFQLPYEGRSPRPGDSGTVVLIDLYSGTHRVIATSAGWETQVGANVQWGRSDRKVYFNAVDVATWQAYATEVDIVTDTRRNIGGSVFMVSPDGTKFASHDLLKSRIAQVGYGVVVPDSHVSKNVGPVDNDGVYVTDVKTGDTRLVASLKTIYEQAVPSISIAAPTLHEYYCFQVKWNRQGTRLLTTVQWTPLDGGKRRRAVITMNSDGTQIRTAVSPDQWARGGHHINWQPDGEHLSMNLNVDDDPNLEIVSVRYDGAEMKTIFEPGSGHPSFHPEGRYIITDAYPYESVAFGNGDVPIRLIDTKAKTCINIARVPVSMERGEFRLDPHPAWDPSGRYVVFNGLSDGKRRVFIADVSRLLAP